VFGTREFANSRWEIRWEEAKLCIKSADKHTDSTSANADAVEQQQQQQQAKPYEDIEPLLGDDEIELLQAEGRDSAYDEGDEEFMPSFIGKSTKKYTSLKRKEQQARPPAETVILHEKIEPSQGAEEGSEQARDPLAFDQLDESTLPIITTKKYSRKRKEAQPPPSEVSIPYESLVDVGACFLPLYGMRTSAYWLVPGVGGRWYGCCQDARHFARTQFFLLRSECKRLLFLCRI